MEGKAHEHDCYPGGVNVDSEERLSIRISLCLPHHSLSARGVPKSPPLPASRVAPIRTLLHPLRKHSLELWVLFVLTSQARALSLEPICGVYALGHRALCHTALGSQLAGAWTRGP